MVYKKTKANNIGLRPFLEKKRAELRVEAIEKEIQSRNLPQWQVEQMLGLLLDILTNPDKESDITSLVKVLRLNDDPEGVGGTKWYLDTMAAHYNAIEQESK